MSEIHIFLNREQATTRGTVSPESSYNSSTAGQLFCCVVCVKNYLKGKEKSIFHAEGAIIKLNQQEKDSAKGRKLVFPVFFDSQRYISKCQSMILLKKQMLKHSNLNENPTSAITENTIVTLAKLIICFEKHKMEKLLH